MQQLPHNLLPLAPAAAHRSEGMWSRKFKRLCVASLLAVTSVQAQQVEATLDTIDREAQFISFLMDQNLFAYANLAMAELRAANPNARDRVEVVEASLLLRTGKTTEVETMLAGRNLATDPKGQAILLQLAMTFDAMGKGDQAMVHYQNFMKLNEGKEIEDHDVLRFFASAGLRLAAIQKDALKFEEAIKTLRTVIRVVDSDVLKRKFSILVAQTQIDFAETLTGTARTARLKEASESAKGLLFGANDNYWYIAMGQHAYINYLQGDTVAALKILDDIRSGAQALEVEMEKVEVPKSEFPRAALRYFEGRIQFDGAKLKQGEGATAEARRLAGQAAGNFYNAFLLYEGNDYASRSALRFDELKAWVKTTFDLDLDPSKQDPRAAELIFKRQLDLAQELLRAGKTTEAENSILRGLAQYPVTPYTLQALGILGRVWDAQDRRWELLALAEYAARMYPKNTEAGTLLKLIGNKMVRDENIYGVETVFSAFGRYFPGDPEAAIRLLMIGKFAADRGDQARAMELYDQLLVIYPGSRQATQVLTLRADEAMKAENYPAAIEAFTQVKTQAPPGFARAQASFLIANAKLRMNDADRKTEAEKELAELRKELAPSSDSIYYRGADKDKSLRLLQNTRFLISQVLLNKAREQNSEDLRKQAAEELNNFLLEYPRADQASDVMYSLGRLQLQQGNTAGAAATFEKLARDFPDSAAGRDALYSLVKAALEENQVEIARVSVAKMIQQPDSYDVEKIFQVGQLMLENERWQEAMDSFALVLKNPRTHTNLALRQRSLYSLGRAALGAGRSPEAIDALTKLITEFSTSSLVVDAGISLSDTHLSFTPPQTAEARVALGKAASILQSRSTPLDQTKLDLATARLNTAENDPGKALLNLYKAGFAKPESPEHAQLVRQAIRLGVDAAMKMAEAGDARRWSLVAELTDQYLRNFPMDKDASEFRALNTRAISLAR